MRLRVPEGSGRALSCAPLQHPCESACQRACVLYTREKVGGRCSAVFVYKYMYVCSRVNRNSCYAGVYIIHPSSFTRDNSHDGIICT